jgi:hypothetical protein
LIDWACRCKDLISIGSSQGGMMLEMMESRFGATNEAIKADMIAQSSVT